MDRLGLISPTLLAVATAAASAAGSVTIKFELEAGAHLLRTLFADKRDRLGTADGREREERASASVGRNGFGACG